jgi:hypothetical protein
MAWQVGSSRVVVVQCMKFGARSSDSVRARVSVRAQWMQWKYVLYKRKCAERRSGCLPRVIVMF